MRLTITSKSFFQPLILCVTTVLLGGSSAVTLAQQASLPYAKNYEIVEFDENDRDRKELSTKNRNAKNAIRDAKKNLQTILQNGGNPSTPETREYFDGYLWPSLTQPENLTNTGKLRDDFKRDFISAKYPASARRSFIESVAIPGLQKLIDSDLAPAARVNATVLLGQLDEAPLNRSSKTPPTPSLNAFQALGKIWQGDYPNFLKAVAFSGLSRHIEIDLAQNSPRIPNDQKSKLMKVVLSQMDATIKKDPKLEDDLNRWQVSKSIKMLSESGLNRVDATFADRFAALIGENSDIPKWTKLEAVRGLNRLSLRGLGAAKVNSMIEVSSTYLSGALTEEANTIQASVDELIYDNILWQNVDLEVTGTDYSGGKSLASSYGSDGYDDDGGSFGSGSTARPARPSEKVKPIVDLPNYELNLARRRMKLLGYTVQQFIRKDAIQNGASAENQNRISKLDQTLTRFLNDDSDIGLMDISKGSATKGSETRGSATTGSATRGSANRGSATRGGMIEESIAMQLKNCCLSTSTEVDRIFGGGGPVAPSADPAAAGSSKKEAAAEESEQPF